MLLTGVTSDGEFLKFLALAFFFMNHSFDKQTYGKIFIQTKIITHADFILNLGRFAKAKLHKVSYADTIKSQSCSVSV